MNAIESIPELETERLYLRGITPADVPAYEEQFVDYEVIRYLNANVPWPYPKGGVETYMNEQVFPFQGKTKWLWCLFPKNDPQKLIGGIELLREGKPENRGFWLGVAYHGHGYMTEAAIATTDFAFDHLGFEKLVFENAVGNSRSARVKEKTGAKLIGTKTREYVDPELNQTQIWELSKEDWKDFRQKKL